MEETNYHTHGVPDIYLAKWQKTLDVLAGVLEVPAALITRVWPRHNEVLVAAKTGQNPYEPGETMELGSGCYDETVMKFRSQLHVANALEDKQWRDNPAVKLNMISYLGFPLLWPDNTVFGAICVQDDKTRHYSGLNHELLEQFKELVEGDFRVIEKRQPDISETAINALRDTFFVFDPVKKKAVRWNNVFSEVSGYGDEEIETMNAPDDWYSEEDLRKAEEGVQRIFRDGYTTTEMSLITKSGERIPTEYSAAMIKDPEGNPKYIISIGRDLTERRQAEKALRENEMLLRNLVENMPVVCFMYDDRGRILNWNRGAEEVYGYTRQEAVGASVYDLIVTPATKEDTMKVIEEVFAGKTIKGSEWRDRDKNGRWGWRMGNTFPIFKDDGSIECGVNVTIDISEHKKAEEELQRERDFNKNLVDSSPAFFVIIDSEGKTRMMNPSMLEALGYSEEEIVGTDYLATFVPEGDREALEKVFEAEIYSGEKTINENRVLTRDGRELSVMWHGSPIVNPEGTINEFFGVGIDITEKRKAEEALKASEEKFAKAFHSSPDSLTISTMEDGRFIEVNEGFEKWSGYTRQEAVGKTSLDLDLYINPEQRRRFVDLIKKNGVVRNLDTDIRVKSGDIHHFLLSAEQIVLKGEPCLVTIARDITERKEAEEKERRYQRQLIQADKMVSLGTLVSGVAHEINNPNNAIMFNAPMLKEIFDDIYPMLEERYNKTGEFELGGLPFSELKESAGHLFDGITRSSDRIKLIVEDLKNFARPDFINLDQEVNMNDVVKASVNLLQNMINKSTHHFTLNCAGNLPAVKGKFQGLEQVIINLVQNACQALENKKQAIEVSTAYEEESGQVLVAVKDYGAGIAQEEIKFIMDPFYTSKRDQGGTGLGLSVSSRIVRDHGGRLDIRSTLGEGSVFTLVLPLPT
jgi:PAS domain S-box-containing protein